MVYQDLEQHCFKRLLEKGFKQTNNIFTKHIARVVGTSIINGRQVDDVAQYTLKLECLGEGSIGDTPTIGFAVHHNDELSYDYWTADPEDIKLLLS